MKIKELPLELQKLVIDNQIEQGNKPNLEFELLEDMEDGNFRWKDSNEGGKFWEKVYLGKGYKL